MPWLSWKNKSFDELPALAVRGDVLRQALRTVTVAWMFGIVWWAGTNGSQLIDFCWMLGFNDFHFGLLSAIGNAAIFTQLFAAMFIERTGLRKWLFIYMCLGHRLLWIFIALIPFVVKPLTGRHGGPAVYVFLLAFAGSYMLNNISAPAWTTWMGDLIPRRIRGRYFAVRRLWTIPIQVAVVIGTGYLLNWVKVPLPEGVVPTFHNQPMLGYVIAGILAVSGLFGAVDVLLFLPMREIASEPLMHDQPRDVRTLARRLADGFAGPYQVLAETLRDKNFRRYSLFCATLNFGATVGGNFFWTNCLKNLEFSPLGANVLFMVLGPLSGMFMAKQWGHLLDRCGRRPVLILATIGVIFSTWGWFVIPPGNHVLAWILGAACCMWGGVTWGAIELGQISTNLGFTESRGRSKFMASAAVVSAVGGILGGLAGGKIAQHFEYMQTTPWHVGPFLWNNYHVTFIVSTIFRALSILWLINMADPGASSVRSVVHLIALRGYTRLLHAIKRPVLGVETWLGLEKGPRPPKPPS